MKKILLSMLLLCGVILLASCTRDNNELNGYEGSPIYKPLPKPEGDVVTADSVDQITSEINNAKGPKTILLKDGTYNVSQQKYIFINKDNISLRSESGNSDNVTIKGLGMNASENHHGILISGKNVTVADMTIRDIRTHGIQVMGERDADNCRIHNVKFIDIHEQMIKISKKNDQTSFCNNGIVEYCVFKFTKEKANQYYTGGVDGHRCNNWIVRHCSFKNINSPEERLAEAAIHFWGMSQNIIVESNLITNCDRGIMFGMGSKQNYGSGGIIFNNRVHTSRDVGISLEQASSVKIYNNTVDTPNYFNSIEIRFPKAIKNIVKNNLVNKNIAKRDNGQAQIEFNVKFEKNETDKLFENYSKQNYKLKSTADKAINKGTTLLEVKYDYEGTTRPKEGKYDVGADEY